MDNVVVDFSTEPAKVKCKVCSVEKQLTKTKKLSETIDQIEAFKKQHEHVGG